MNKPFVVYLLRTCRLVIIITVCIFFARSFIVEPGRVNGRSMEQAYQDEDIFLVNKLILLFREPQRGDVIQFIDPNTRQLIIKRVIGLPGERVRIEQGHVVIILPDQNEIVLGEPYVEDGIRTTQLYEDVPSDEPIAAHSYFVLGDNRERSVDSRVFGAIDRTQIQGLVVPLRW